MGHLNKITQFWGKQTVNEKLRFMVGIGGGVVVLVNLAQPLLEPSPEDILAELLKLAKCDEIVTVPGTLAIAAKKCRIIDASEVYSYYATKIVKRNKNSVQVYDEFTKFRNECKFVGPSVGTASQTSKSSKVNSYDFIAKELTGDSSDHGELKEDVFRLPDIKFSTRGFLDHEIRVSFLTQFKCGENDYLKIQFHEFEVPAYTTERNVK